MEDKPRFIRVRGRIVPIRSKEDRKIRNLGVGVGVGAATYAASRIPIPTKNKLLANERAGRRFFENKLSKAKGISFLDKETILTQSFDDVATKAGSSKIKFAKIFKDSAEPAKMLTEKSLRAASKDKLPFMVKGVRNSTKAVFLTEQNKISKKLIAAKRYLIQPRLTNLSEYRVTTAAGKATSITHRRFSKGHTMGAIFPVLNPFKRREIAKYVESAMRKTKMVPERSGILGFDVMKSQKGLRLIELNQGPMDLFNPIKRLKAKTYLLGRLPKRSAIAVSLLAGIGAGIGAWKYGGKDGK